MTKSLLTPSLDMLSWLIAKRRKPHPHLGRRWTTDEIEKHKRHMKRLARKRWRAGYTARRQPQVGMIRARPDALSLSERCLLVMLPGEWLTVHDVAERAGLTAKRIKPILMQKLTARNFIVAAPDPEAPPLTARWDGIRSHGNLYALTWLGCAARQSRIVFAENIGADAPIIEMPSDWIFPKNFFDSFRFDFSPFFGGVLPHGHRGTRAATLAAHARALAALAPGAGPHDVAIASPAAEAADPATSD